MKPAPPVMRMRKYDLHSPEAAALRTFTNSIFAAPHGSHAVRTPRPPYDRPRAAFVTTSALFSCSIPCGASASGGRPPKFNAPHPGRIGWPVRSIYAIDIVHPGRAQLRFYQVSPIQPEHFRV